MQVRKSLQNQKSHHHKNLSSQPQLHIPKQKKSQKTIRSQKSKSKSKSNSEKENARSRMLSKSRQKVSPIKIKKKQVLNTSPIIHTQRIQRKKSKKSVSPIKSKQKNYKVLNSYREIQAGCHTISTKLNTDRTPIKKHSQQLAKTKPSTLKKKKKIKDTAKLKIKKKWRQQAKQKEQEKQQFYNTHESHSNRSKAFKKSHKTPLQINTIGPKRKQSYFDNEILEKLSLDKSQFRRRKNIKQANDISETKIKSQTHTYNETRNNATTEINMYQQYGTITQQNMINPPISYRDLQSFRKQQEMKWKIMSLELCGLKNNITPQKIQLFIEESDKNLTQFDSKSKELANSVIINRYIFQSPRKVKNALHNANRKSSQESKQILKNLSDKKLLQELENLEFSQFKISSNYNSNENMTQQKGTAPNFYSQFEKQLQNYSKNQQKLINIHNKQLPYTQIDAQISHIPQLQFSKAMQIYHLVQNILMNQICDELVQNQKIFHTFLSRQRQLQEFPQYKIQTSTQFSLNLIHQFFNYISTQNLTQQILRKLNIPFGNKPESNLKYLRHNENESDMQADENDRIVQPVMDFDLIQQFEQYQGLLNQEQINQSQYIYNNCIFNCINEIFDTLRPYGEIGLSPLEKQQNIPIKYTNFNKISTIIIQKLKQILQLKIGRTTNFNQYQLYPIKIAQKAYTELDKFLTSQQQQKWKRNEDLIFEYKYNISQSVIEDIINNQTLMIFNQFL